MILHHADPKITSRQQSQTTEPYRSLDATTTVRDPFVQKGAAEGSGMVVWLA
jgi:hypothetical protein